VALDVVKKDPDDNRILECAVAAASEYIVTEAALFTSPFFDKPGKLRLGVSGFLRRPPAVFK